MPFSRIDASYVDIWSYGSPQLYFFSGDWYGHYDIGGNQFMGAPEP